MKRVLTVILAFFLTLGSAAATDKPGLKSGVFDPPHMAPDFSLRGSDGSEVSLARFRGKLVVLEFGFTSCPDVCPVSLAMLAEARKKLGSLADQVQVLYLTVDPERDTAEHMRRYLSAFDSSFIGVTGTAELMARVRKEYGISATRKITGGGKAGYGIDHSSYLYIVDRHGRLRALMPHGRTTADIVHDVTLLLKS